jgi:hypothetical protein
MYKKIVFLVSFVTLCVVASSNYLGIKYNLYWIYKWFDIPVHMLGGLWVSLFYLYLCERYNHIFHNLNFNNLFKNLLLALLVVTISWEIFELVIGSVHLDDGFVYWSDTISDIINGFIGGILGYLFYNLSKKNFNKTN